MCALVELEVGETEGAVVLGLVTGAPEDGVDSCDDLGQGERLGDVVVAPDGQTGQLVLQRVASGEEEDGDAKPVGTQAPGHLETIQVGQHDVEDQEVGRVFLGLRQGLAPRRRLVDGEPLVAQRRRHCIDD